MTKWIYGPINKPKDITSNNKKMRSEISSAKSRDRITELKARSRYLITLTFGPALRKRKNASALRKRAKSEYNKTKKLADKKLERMGI